MVGTHTHVSPADERVLPQGPAHISYVGMTGCYNSVIGADTDIILRRFVDRMPVRIEPASGRASICGVVIDIDEATGLSRVIERVRVDEQETGTT